MQNENENPFDYNPFKAPEVRVKDNDEFEQDDGFIKNGRRVSLGNGFNWVGIGWKFFKEDVGIWVCIALIITLITLVVGFIPVANFFYGFFFPVFAAGLMLGCKALDSGEKLSVNHLFAGFSQNTGNLVLSSIVCGIIFIIIMAIWWMGIFMLAFGSALIAGSLFVLVPLIIICVVIALLISLLSMIVMWFSSALIVLRNEEPIEAIKMSFKAGIKNIFPFGLCAIVFIILFVIASIPLFLGLLVLLPVTFGAVYAAYCDIFFEEAGSNR